MRRSCANARIDMRTTPQCKYFLELAAFIGGYGSLSDFMVKASENFDSFCFLIISVQLVNQCLTVPHLIFFIYLFQIIVRKMYYVHLMNFVEKYFYFVEIILNFCIIVYVPLKYYSIYLNF